MVMKEPEPPWTTRTSWTVTVVPTVVGVKIEVVDRPGVPIPVTVTATTTCGRAPAAIVTTSTVVTVPIVETDVVDVVEIWGAETEADVATDDGVETAVRAISTVPTPVDVLTTIVTREDPAERTGDPTVVTELTTAGAVIEFVTSAGAPTVETVATVEGEGEDADAVSIVGTPTVETVATVVWAA